MLLSNLLQICFHSRSYFYVLLLILIHLMINLMFGLPFLYLANKIFFIYLWDEETFLYNYYNYNNCFYENCLCNAFYVDFFL